MSHDHRDVILRPVVSEKSYAALDGNVYTFEVAPGANKVEIRQAVEAILDRKSTRLNSSHTDISRMPSSA